MSLPSEGQSLSANQISSRYLNWRLRYNYFRFRNTNVRHIGILLPVSISTNFSVIGVSCHIRLPNFVQIGTSAAENWRHIDFQDGGRQPCCICFGVMAEHPRSAFLGLNSDLKSLVRRINSSGLRRYSDVKILAFWLETACSRPFLWSFCGIFSPYDVTHRPDPQKALPWAETRHLSHHRLHGSTRSDRLMDFYAR